MTPHTKSGVSPAEMLLGRPPRSRLDILRPLTTERVEEKQIKQKNKHDAYAHERLLNKGDTVLVQTTSVVKSGNQVQSLRKQVLYPCL